MMGSQLTSNAEALRLFFTDDVYLVKSNVQPTFAEPVNPTTNLPQPAVVAEVLLLIQHADSGFSTSAMVKEPEPEFKKVTEFKSLGKNQKHILILVNDKDNDVSTGPGRELLRKLVLAINLTAKDFALVNYAGYEGASFSDLKQAFHCKYLLSFGVSAPQLGLKEQVLHQLVTHPEGSLIFTKNLQDLDTDQASKKILWGSLQKINHG